MIKVKFQLKPRCVICFWFLLDRNRKWRNWFWLPSIFLYVKALVLPSSETYFLSWLDLWESQNKAKTKISRTSEANGLIIFYSSEKELCFLLNQYNLLFIGLILDGVNRIKYNLSPSLLSTSCKKSKVLQFLQTSTTKVV